MRLVTLKSEAQLDLQVLHRARERLVTARTRLTNQLRAVLLERGIILPKRRAPLRHRLHEPMAGELPISPRVIRSLQDLREEWESLDERLRAYDDELAALTRENQQARQLATIPGIGVINATALLAAWLGLTPRQHSTGGRTKLLGISKRGNKYLRTQLLAAKLARIVWAVLRHGRAFEHQGHAMA
jgi:transposase